MKKICDIASPFFNNTSEAKTARNLVHSLYGMNASFSVTDLSLEFEHFSQFSDVKLHKIMAQLQDCGNCPRILNSNFPYSERFMAEDLSIPYFSLKTNGIPLEHVNILKNKNRIFVYNSFTKDILFHSGVNEEKIIVLPPSVNARTFRKAEPFGVNGKKGLSFLSVVNVRRDPNWMAVVRSFYQSFSLSDDVCLVLKANDSFYSKYYQLAIAREIDAEKKRYKKKLPRVILIASSLSDLEMASLYADCDFFVRISGVNSGMSFVEAFASGLICIGPGEGGSREILNRNTGFMIKKSGEKRISAVGKFNGITYNTYSEEHLSEIMQWVVDNYKTLKEKTDKERKIVLSQFDYNVVGQKLLKSLR